MPAHVPAAGSGALLVTLLDANNAPMGKANVYISQLSVTIRNGPTSPAYTQTMNDYRSSWVGSAWRTQLLQRARRRCIPCVPVAGEKVHASLRPALLTTPPLPRPQKVHDNGSITVPLLAGSPLPRAQWLTRAGFMYDVRVFYLGQLVKVGAAQLGCSLLATTARQLACLPATSPCHCRPRSLLATCSAAAALPCRLRVTRSALAPSSSPVSTRS
jgi:hypothetical protein